MGYYVVGRLNQLRKFYLSGIGGRMITQEKHERVRIRMEELDVREEDLDEHFIRGSGKGGQKVNKTSSCVQLIHRPSGIEIRCQKTRSQADNRYWARRDLCERIEEIVLGEKSAKQQAMEKIRRQKRRRSRRAKARMLDSKTKQSTKKRLRGRVSPSD